MKQTPYNSLVLFIAVPAIMIACYSSEHTDIPDKAEVQPILGITIPNQGIEPTPEPTPEKSACEFEVDDLKADNQRLREMIQDVAPSEVCTCTYDSDQD